MKPHINLRRETAAILIFVSLGFLFLGIRDHVTSAQSQIQVTSANPPSAVQGTVNLDVTVSGSGFKKGAKAQWFVTGTTNPGGVTVNSTAFVNSNQLTANITVAADATISNFDIAVTDPDGRGGKGTELFAVTSNGNGSSASAGCTVQPLPAGISLVNSLNYLNPDGSAHYSRSLGTTMRARQMTLNGVSVVVVGVSAQPGTNDPRLHIFFVDPASGQTLDNTMIGTATAVQPHITLAGLGGNSLAVGDVNGDGTPDFIASGGGANAVVGSIDGNGVVSYQLYPLPMPASASNFKGVAMGDLNGLGNDEVAVGATGGSGVLGEVCLFTWNGSGFTNYQNIPSPLPNPKKDEYFGGGVAIADVTGTSAKDLIVGARTSTVNGQSSAGRVFVFPGPVNASTYLTFTTGVKNDEFGSKVAAGDVSGDLTNDLLGTTFWNNNTDIRAQVYNGLVSQGQSPNFILRPTNSALATGWSTTEPDIFDVNGDGLGDVLIGAPNAASGSICGGAAYLYLSAGLGSPMATRLMLTTPVLDPSGQTSFQAFGWATAFAGSGSRLFFVSDHGLDLGSTANAGQVYVYKVN